MRLRSPLGLSRAIGSSIKLCEGTGDAGLLFVPPPTRSPVFDESATGEALETALTGGGELATAEDAATGAATESAMASSSGK
jgi:hypothetical protein